jgi:hypothetical protein
MSTLYVELSYDSGKTQLSNLTILLQGFGRTEVRHNGSHTRRRAGKKESERERAKNIRSCSNIEPLLFIIKSYIIQGSILLNYSRVVVD